MKPFVWVLTENRSHSLAMVAAECLARHRRTVVGTTFRSKQREHGGGVWDCSAVCTLQIIHERTNNDAQNNVVVVCILEDTNLLEWEPDTMLSYVRDAEPERSSGVTIAMIALLNSHLVSFVNSGSNENEPYPNAHGSANDGWPNRRHR